MIGALSESPGEPGPEARAAPCSVRNLNRGYTAQLTAVRCCAGRRQRRRLPDT